MDGDDSSNEHLPTFKSNQAAINRGLNPNRMYKNQSRNNEQYQQHQLHHWSSSIKEVSVAFGSNKLLNVIFLGGSCDASFIYVASIDHKNVNYKSGFLEEGDIILEVEGEKVSGYILKSFLDKLADLARDNKPIIFKAVKKGALQLSLSEYLNKRFAKDSVDHQHQQIIRRNIYKTSLPYTTRPPRDDEVDGVDYKFLTVDEFLELERSGKLLERGLYEGNFYGTPKPESTASPSTSTISANYVIPWAGLPEQLYSFVNKTSTSSASATTSTTVSTTTTSSSSSSSSASSTNVSINIKHPSFPINTSTTSKLFSSANSNNNNFKTCIKNNIINNNNKTSVKNDSVNNSNAIKSVESRNFKVDVSRGSSVAQASNSSTPSSTTSSSPYSSTSLNTVIHYDNYRECRESPIERPSSVIDKHLTNNKGNMAAQQKRAYSTTPTTNDPNHEIGVVTNANSISSDLYNNYINNNSSNSLNNNQLMNSSNQTSNEILAINQQQMHQVQQQHRQQQQLLPQPQQPLQQLITTMLKKTSRGLGFTIRGLEDEDGGGVWLVIKSILPAGPAEMDGKLQRGDVLVSVNDHDVCGLTHFDVVNMFRQLEINQEVKIEVIRGHHSTLNFDLYDGEVNDPSVEVLTTVAVGNADGDDSESSYYSEDVGNARVVYDYHKCMTYNNGSIFSGGPQDIGGGCPYYEYQGLVGVKKIELIIVKGPTGFGFTLADRPEGQKVKQLVDMNRCRGLSEDDLLLEINNQSIRNFSHLEVVQMLKLCPTNQPALFLVERKVLQSKCLNVNDVNSSSSLQLCTLNGGSCMPNSPYYFRPYSAGSQMQHQQHFLTGSKQLMKHQEHNLYLPLQKDYESNNRSFKQSPCMVHEHLRKQLSSPSSASTLIIDSLTYPQQTPDFIPANVFTSSSTSSESKLTANESGYVGSVSSTSKPQTYRYCSAVEPHNLHHCCNEFCSSCYADNLYLDSINNNNNKIVNANINAAANNNMIIKTVFLKKSPTGFGFRVVGGKEEGSQATIGHIVPGGPAYLDGNLCVGQEIVLIDGLNVEGAWHKDVVDLINMAAQKGEVMLGVRDPTDFLNNNQMESMHLSQQLHDVILTRNENEGFGFYILSSAIKSSPVIGQIVENSPASRAANLKIGSQIIAINNNLILNNMSHNQIVDIIKSSGTSIKLTLTDSTPSAPSIDRMIMQATEFKNEGTADSEVAIIDIDLHRSNKGFGFSIRGGQEFNLMPLYVLKIAHDGAAKLDGRLQVGDEILKINDAMTQGMTHRDAINIVQSTQAVLHLTIRRFANLSEADDL